MIRRFEGFFKGFAGVELFYQAWKPESAKANIIITHGMGEHSESYIHFAEGMSDSQMNLFAWDLRGHGRSEGKRGVVGSFDEYCKDLEYFINTVEADNNLPTYFLGHSMGGLVVVKTAIMRDNLNTKGIILSSPLLGLSIKVPKVKDMAARLLVKLAPSLTLYNEIDHNDLTHDKDIVRSYGNDPLRHDQICSRLYLDWLESFEYIKANIHKWNYPLYMQLAGDDKLVSLPSSLSFFDKIDIEDKQKVVYEGYLHEIYNEVGRNKVFSDLKEWLKSH